MSEVNMGGLHEECGVFGIYDPEGNCAQATYYGLYALQHRGQESCGIAVNKDREISSYKGMGLINEVFDNEILQGLPGTMAIGHVRYSTCGESKPENTQPLVLNYIKGTLALAHNGNLINADKLRDEFSRTGAIFQTTTDTEVIAYAIARERVDSHSIEEAVNLMMPQIQGAFSLIVMSPQKLIAARDPWGFRPLCMGRRDKAIIFASESCALDAVGAEFEREVMPGEIIVVENGKVTSNKTHCTGISHACIFEHVYFARPDSVIENNVVVEARKMAGRLLARQAPVDADIVIGVPDSGIGAALGYAQESGIPYDEGFVKNRYTGRTFIKPDQSVREDAVRIKLNPLRSVVGGKRVVMVDDSIVRGTTCNRIVNLLREAGATEVHVRISSPPFLYPCFFGTDIPSCDALVATGRNTEEIREIIGADSLAYLSIENIHKIAPNKNCEYCDGCFTGRYPIEEVNQI